MIDLSFLTEEEQEAIMKVLQRDAQLKKAEEDRVRVLEDTIDDTNELKNKTGQWFYEAKSKRHRDKIHGADLIRASIRKKKPLTIAELTQSRTDKTKKSWVNNVNKDLFVPPELVGVMEEPDREDEEEKTQGQLYRSAPKVDTLSFEEPPQSTIKGVSSPSKQRKNPFNDPTLEVGFELNTENHISENGSAHLYDLAEKDIMPSSQRSEHNEKMPKFEQNEDNQNFSDALDGLERKSEQKIPKPKVRTVTYKIADTQSDSDSSFSKPPKRNDSLNGTGTRKGILKRSPSSSSTDSEILRISQSLDSQSKTLSPNSPILEGEAVKNYLQNPPDQSSQSSIDRLKQVRFTSVDVPDTLPPTPDTHKGREIGEFDLLESDYAKNSKDDIDGVKPLYNEHESIQNSIYAHPERVDMDPDVAATASNEEDRDITLDASSNLCLNLKTEAPGPPQVPPTSLITTQPHQSSSEVLQEKRSLVDAASIKTSNHIFDNIRENEEPTSGTFPNRDSSDLSSLASQASTLSIDQQPVYAKINTPRLSKLDSSDKLQGKESIDESDPSRKTETMIMDNTKPNNDDKRDNFNVPQNANLLKFNTDVQESKDETFRTSKHFSDQQPLHAEIKSPQVSKLSASDHQQGKPDHVEELNAKTSSKSDKYINEFKKAADESISKVLDWFNRDSEHSTTQANHNNSPKKIFIEESGPSPKTETRVIVSENTRSNADLGNQLPSTENAQWRGERLSFGNYKNGGGKSGDVDFPGKVDVETKTLDSKNVQQRVDDQLKSSSEEQLLFGKSRSGGGKICFESEHPRGEIQKANLFTTETVPKSYKENQENGDRRNINFSPDYIEEPKKENNPNYIFRDSMQIEDLSSPTKKDTEKPQENKANKPAILKQNTHMQQPDTEEKGLPTRIEIKSDIKSFWEGGKPMTKSSPTTHKFKENTRSYAIDTGLVKDPVSINSNVSLEKELQIEAQTPNVKDVRASWEKKGVQKSRPEQLKNETSDKHTKSTDLEQNVPGKIVSSYAEGLLQKKTNINYETINKHDSLSGIDRSLNSLQKPNFKVHSLKERISEGSADKVSNPEQFQSLRTFWETDKKSPVKPEIQTSFRSVPTLHDSKSSGSVELRANVNQNTHNSLQDQNKEVSDVDEKDLYIKEWYQKESQLIVVPKHEVVEAVEKVRAPSKSEDDSLKGSLQRLSQEASEMKDVAKPTAVKSAKPTSNDNALNSEEQNIGKKTPDTLSPNKATFPTSPTGETVPGQGSFYENVKKRSLNISDGQKTQTVQPKVSSTVLKTSKPRINDSFDVKTTLKKQLSEASKNSDPALTQQILLEQSPQEIQETIDKTAVPPKADVHEFRAGLQKLLEEESRIPPVASRNADKVQQSAFQPANENAFENANSTRLSDSYEIQNKVQDNRDEIHETVIKMAAPEKVEFSAFDSGLEKLYKEASEPSPKTTDAEENVNGSLSEREQPFLNKSGKNMHDSEKTFPGREEVSESEQSLFAPRMVVTAPGPLASQQTPFPPEVKETVDKIVLPNTDVAEFDASLEKLYQEALESPETDEVEHGQNFAFRPEEITLADLQVSRVDSFDTKVLIKKETLNQASLVEEKESMDKHVSLIKDPAFAEAPNRNVVFLHKKVHTSTPSENKQQPVGEDIDTVGKTEKGFEHPVNKEFEVKDLVNGRGYSPEVDIPDTFLRASTPVKEINRNVQNSTIDMVLSSQHEIKDDAKSMDSVLLDGNDGLYAEVRKKPSRSEEELSPVLAVLRRSSAKPVPSKSLEDLSSASSNQRADKQEAFYESISEHQKTDKQESFHEPVSESPTGPSYPDNRFSDPEKVKRLSKSVPDFLQDESDDRETDSASEGSFQLGRHKKTPSSLTNLSGSSGMASLSSVSGSVMSIYSGDFGNVDIKGNIQFAIDYVDQLQEFHIFVAQCKELAVAEVKKNRSDPYVKSYLLPDKEKMGKRKTAVRKKTLNPAYNEILRYKISKQTLLTQKLNLSVWHNDMFGRNSFLGEVDIDLATWDWNNKQMNWFPLQPRTPAAGMGLEYRGEMTVALKHSTVPTSGKNAASNGEVYIWVKSCSNLPVLRGNRINSFVKCTVLPDTSRKSRQKTRTVDKTVNPVFNHTMVYDGFRAEDLREACVELTVWDHNRLSNHFLGGLRLGSGSGKSYGTPVDWMDSTSYETSLWKRMISSPDQWVEDTLQLRMLMMAKMTK
ncbi:synaptotagmin-like protein 2 isoform X3 [Pleurodeles waltl]|uniref:synaptotagmin-like protein 2 isoform X3 n=1 Tax=Pleurodeles waltl TaxID=8319 RepID=UPI0037097360